jgi:hypothetical protein
MHPLATAWLLLCAPKTSVDSGGMITVGVDLEPAGIVVVDAAAQRVRRLVLDDKHAAAIAAEQAGDGFDCLDHLGGRAGNLPNEIQLVGLVVAVLGDIAPSPSFGRG